MGIYLPNMEMPKGRPVCIVIDAAGQARRYDLNNDRYADDELFEAVPVPEHGRVIDVDKVLDELAHNLGIRSLDYLTPSERAIVSWFRDAPTIIPESEEGE